MLHSCVRRLQRPASRAGSLLLLFQRSPIVQMLLPEANTLGGFSLSQLTPWAITAVIGLESYDSVAGATTVSQISPNSGSTTVVGAVGSNLNFVFQCTGAPGTPGSWSTTALPAGLTHTNPRNNSVDSITGTPTTAGTYSVTVTAWENSGNSGGKSAKTFTLNIGDTIISSQPASITIPSGTSTTLSVTASGSPLAYQWYQGATGVTTSPISGATSSSYTTPALSSNSSYWVKVTRGTTSTTSNTVSANSNTATISVGSPPSFTTQPASVTINSGQSTTLNAAASGSPTYQWYLGDSGSTTTPVGTNSASYTTPTLTTSTHYWVRATNASGHTDSSTAIITVNPPLIIASHPGSITLDYHNSTTLSVSASGTGTLSYQWYQGNSGVTTTPVGTNSSSFTTGNLTQSTNYWVRVTDTNGFLNSNTAAITVNPAIPPTITRQPSSPVIESGSSATLTVEYSGSPATFQWYRGPTGDTSQPENGAVSNSFSTGSITQNSSWWVRLTNPGGSADSQTATVNVATAPAIITQPVSREVPKDSSTTLFVAASGSPPLTYQWYLGDTGDISQPIALATQDTFTTPNIHSLTHYWVRVTNPLSHADSQTAAVSIPQVTLTTAGPHGSVTGAGIYDTSSTIQIQATADPGYLFSGWGGDANGSDNPLSVLMDQSKTINATFSEDSRDPDADGLTNFQEIITYQTNPNLADTDGDGLPDGIEVLTLHTNPNLADSNANGIPDGSEDSDGDGLNNFDEITRFHTNPALADSNSDGLSDAYAATFVGTPIRPCIGNQVSFNLNSLLSTGQTLKLVGKPPKGLAFNAKTGQITGIITATAGTYPLSIQILQGKTVVRTISLPIVVQPFPSSLLGNFDAILENANSTPIGALHISITAADTWSATLDYAGAAKARSAKGKFVLQQGAPIAPISLSFAAASPAPAITLNVSLDGSNPTFSGNFSAGTFRGFKAASGATLPAATMACSLSFDAGNQDGISAPAGYGWATGTFAPTGAGSFKGTLGDGTAVTFSLRLSSTGQAILWSQPYANKSSYFGGLITLPGIARNPATALTPQTWWIKGADAKSPSYPNGFPGMNVQIGSSTWLTPANPDALGSSLGWTGNRSASIRIFGAELNNASQPTAGQFPTTLTLTDSYALNRSAPTSGPLIPWSGSVTPANGSFTGTLTLPSGISTSILSGAATTSGVLLQDDSWGTVSGRGLIKIPISGAKGAFRTAAIELGQ